MRKLSVLAALLLSAALPLTTGATCPESLCDCLGAATQFDIVAMGSVSLRPGVRCSENLCSWYGSGTGEACAETARLFAHFDGFDDWVGGSVSRDLVLLAGPGSVAGRLIGSREEPDEVAVYRTLATGGGRVLAPNATIGTLDTTGTNPLVSVCRDAVDATLLVSQELAALAPTQSLGRIDLRGDESMVIDAGPGVNVIDATSINLQPLVALGYYSAPTLFVRAAPETQSVIINTKKLKIGPFSGVEILGEDRPFRFLINVNGRGAKVRLGLNAYTEVPLLAPDRVVQLAFSVDDSSAIFAKRVDVRGALVGSGEPLCP
jgi:hypothetical protein